MHDPRPGGTVAVFDGVSSVACGDALLVLWQLPARRARIERVAAWIDELVTATEQVVVCQFLLARASPPDREGRAIARREALRLEPRVRRAVMVPLGDSLWRSTVRGILRVAVVIAGHGHKLEIAASEREAIDAVVRAASSRSAGRADLERAVDAIFVALGEPCSPRVAR